VAIGDGTQTTVYEEVLPAEFLADGTIVWQWDGHNTNGVFDAESLVRPLSVTLSFEHGGRVTNVRSATLNTETVREWVTATVDPNTRTIAVRIYVDCQNEDDLRLAEFQRLRGMVLGGIGTYWSRSLTVNGVQYAVTTTAHQRSSAAEDLDLYVETGTDYRRSHNSGIIDASIFYNRGFYGGANAAANQDFALTAAHEFGHSVLWAIGGKSLSWGHKGTVNDSLLSIWDFQDPSPSATPHPAAGEIDLMKYYTDAPPGDYHSRVVAAAEDVIRLISLSTVVFSVE
jgi:hypothetical protein